MSDNNEKHAVQAPTGTDQPKFAGNDVPASDADMALAAMGYKPVSLIIFYTATCGPDVPGRTKEESKKDVLTNLVQNHSRSSRENSVSGLPSVLPSAFLVSTAP